jgi:adenosine deaminase
MARQICYSFSAILNYSKANLTMQISSIPAKLSLVLSAAILILSPGAHVQQGRAAGTQGTPTAEMRMSHLFEGARTNPLELRAFLAKMPKGADLHNHLAGAVYAESWLRAGAEDHLCIDLKIQSFAKPSGSGAEGGCTESKVPASKIYQDPDLYNVMIDAFSMRGFVPSPGMTGHDHFFDTFDKFRGTDPKHKGEWLDEVATRAAAQNEQYLELMETPDFSHTILLSHSVAWHDDFAQVRKELLDKGLREDVAEAKKEFDSAEATRKQREHCGQQDATAACGVEIRYLYQVLRGFPKEQVFAQALLGFEVASSDPRVVGINFVMPEDGHYSMMDYALQMKMVAFLRTQYPQVHVSLHAGELAMGLVPPDGLCCHVRLAVEVAHAERIGHGTDIMFENQPFILLKEMAATHTMVEINLTSNDLILGVSGRDHPFVEYRKANVPIALSTDDEGVSRIDLTNEFYRAVTTYYLHYWDLKQMVRTSLEHSFLPGASLWNEQDVFTRATNACASDELGGEKPSAGCAEFLKGSEKARQQWELERRYKVFEEGY